MRWWGKSSKEGKKKDRKPSVVDILHENLGVLSEEKGPRSGTPSRHYTDTVSKNTDQCSVNYQHPSPTLQVSCSGVPYQGGQDSATHLVDSGIGGIGRSNSAGCKRGSQPLLLRSCFKPVTTVDTSDGKYIDMKFTISSDCTNDSSDCDDPTHRHLLTNQVSGYETTENTSTNCPSRSVHSRQPSSPSNSLLNNQSVSINPKRQPRASFSEPNSKLSSPLVTPRRVICNDPSISSCFSPGKSQANTFVPSSGHDSFRIDHISGQSSVGRDVPELNNRQHIRCSPLCFPTLSSKMKSAHNSRVNSPAVTPLHLHVEGACPEHSGHHSDDRTQQSYRLPLPPVKTSRTVSTKPSYSTGPNSQVLQSSVQADNLPSPTSRWKKGRLLGCGTFGQVYLSLNKETGEMCAMKEVILYSGDPKSKESARQLSQEIALLSELHHPNIVQYYGSEMVGNSIYIYLEYVSGGSIHKVLQEYGPLGEAAIRSFTRQILSGLAYLHAKNTAHRDVKGSNILLEPCGCVKLADFGMAKHITGETGRMSFRGSPYWIAPKVVRNSYANVSVDIWSLGCTILEMATGKPPWSQYEEVGALFKIGHSMDLPPIPDFLSVEGKDFIIKCLQRDPLLRHTASQLLDHPFVIAPTSSESHIPSGQNFNCLLHSDKKITDDSPKNRPWSVSPIRKKLPQSQSPRYVGATGLTPPILRHHGSSGSSVPTRVDVGAIPFHHPHTLQNISERLPPTSVPTPRSTHSSSAPVATGSLRAFHHSESSKHCCERLTLSPFSSPRVASPTTSIANPRGTCSSSVADNVRQYHYPESPKHRYEWLIASPVSSPRAASASSLAHLAGDEVSLPFHTKSPRKNLHGNPVSMSRQHTSSHSSANTSCQDVKSDMFRHVTQSPRIPQVIPTPSFVKRDQIGRNVSGLPSELANCVSPRPPREVREHVKFNYP